jgi:hypothetical protein
MQRAAAASPSKPDTAAIKAAAAEETARREAATLALRPRLPGPGDDRDTETQWQLSYVRDARHTSHGLKVASVGFSELQIVSSDSEKDDEEEVKEEGSSENTGRLVFGNFRKKSSETPSKKEGDPDSNDSSDSDEEDEDETPRRKNMGKRDPLHGLTSISNAGSSSIASIKCRSCKKTGHKAADCPNLECYACGGLGHMSSDCPNPRNKRKDFDGSRDYAHTKKARRSM